jgi:GT2 family glycosyltransferase
MLAPDAPDLTLSAAAPAGPAVMRRVPLARGAAAGAESGGAESGGVADAIRELARPARVRVAGKCFYRGDEKLLLRGVTYGPFRPDAEGELYRTPDVVARDFALMRQAGVNCVRVYTAPPRWLLDLALDHGLLVLAGIPWSQYVAFLDDPQLRRDSFDQVRKAIDRCAGHPALLGYTIGNEIPGGIVRWYGHRRVERHLARLARMIRRGDPDALITYANYPTTEYLDLPFLDFVSFNVYLDFPDRFDAYLGRLHNIAGERPLVMSEIGMDSVYYGEPKQAAMLTQKIDAVFGGGCAGMFVFAWTDEWFRHGQDITEWKFGLVDAGRRPRASFSAVADAFARLPIVRDRAWPRVTVAVCTYNGSRTIAETVGHLLKLDYPDYEVLVIDDGSTDATASIVQRAIDSHDRAVRRPPGPVPDVKLIHQPNQGLSVARNVAIERGTGEVIAYIDDDAWPDPHWLKLLVTTLIDGGHVGAGGPNVAPAGDGETAECVSHAPGGPTHVLLTDFVAEHIPGCNMAFRRDALAAIGGFDAQFRIAGDDVDLCWRLQDAGGTLGFSPAAQVFHHRRNSVKAFWKQQLNYGRAEAALERKWPAKYNAVGHATWSGRLYSPGVSWLFNSRRRIYHGVWGEALFQQVYHVPPSLLGSLPMMPEWYVLLAALAAVTAAGLAWWPMFLAAPLLAACLGFAGQQALAHAGRAVLHDQAKLPAAARWRMRLKIAFLYRMQPLARLIGRYTHGLVPWRSRRGVSGFAWPSCRLVDVGVKKWRFPSEWLTRLETDLRGRGAAVLRGGDFDGWDLTLRGGLFGGVRVTLMSEDLEYGAQLLRFRARPAVARLAPAVATLLTALALVAGINAHRSITAAFAGLAMLLAALTVAECGAALATVRRAAREVGDKE